MSARPLPSPISPHRTARSVAGIVFVGLLALGACARPHAAPAPAARSQLRVGIAPNYPPLAFTRNGALAGVEVDFARQLEPALGVETRLVQTRWDDLIPALRAHRIDLIMSGMSVTLERQQLVRFTHPYLRVGQMLVFRRADAKRFHDTKAINTPATRVGFVSGTTGETYARVHWPRAHAVGADSAEAGAAGLRAKTIDVFIADAPAIYALTSPGADPQHDLASDYEPLTQEYLAWAVRLDDPGLQTRLDTVLTAWNADGTLDRILGRWMHVRREPRRTRSRGIAVPAPRRSGPR
jgi:ABC-type amino acid transport substrate-binding protein